jgi:hypothetical protein
MSRANSFTKIQCPLGYFGPYCTPTCFGKNTSDFNICSNHGNCLSPNNCTCSNGYTGNECQLHICYGKNSSDVNVCSGKGTCLSPSNCTCSNGYTGNDCQLNICYGKNSSDVNVCSGHGNCISPSNCTCLNGYTGNDCQLNICYGKNSSDVNVCSGKGTCLSPSNCTCSNGYLGLECEYSFEFMSSFIKSSNKPTNISIKFASPFIHQTSTNSSYFCVLDSTQFIGQLMNDSTVNCIDIQFNSSLHVFISVIVVQNGKLLNVSKNSLEFTYFCKKFILIKK